MNIGVIWDKIDKTDRQLIQLCLHEASTTFSRSKMVFKNPGTLVFVDINYILRCMSRNLELIQKSNLIYTTVDREEERTKRIIELIKDELK